MLDYKKIFRELEQTVHEARPDLDPVDTCKRLNNCYRAMVVRCTAQGSEDYIRYGERGIGVCGEWATFPAGRDRYVMWAVTHGWVPGMTVDRMNNDGPYSPENCRMAGRTLQAANTRNTKIRSLKMSQSSLRRLLHVGCDRISRMSDEELTERLCELADRETAMKREARDRLRHGKCPCCGANAIAVYRSKDDRIVGCPDCLVSEDIFTAAVDEGAI